MHNYIRVGSYDLLLRCKLGTLLELEVANGTGESKVAIDPTEIDKATSGSNSSLFAYRNKITT
jgi:hypothetical protein